MKTAAALMLLVTCTQALDLSKLKPMRFSSPVVNHKYVGVHHHQSRIVGGDLATRGQFPWEAFIIMDDSYVCAGSLISDQWVISSGGCTYNFKSFNVWLGVMYNDKCEPGSVKVVTTEKLVHNDYNPSTFEADLALLKLPNPVSYTDYINYVKLPPYSMVSDSLVGEEATVSGWGLTNDGSGTISNALRFVKMTVMSNYDCKQVYGDAAILDSMICTDTAGGHSPCDGDTGAPLVLMHNGYLVQVGIFSFRATDGCEKGFPAGFSRVTNYLAWIGGETGIVIDP